MFKQANLFNPLPNAENSEVFDDIVKRPFVRIERIVSHGQTSPDEGWYDQDEHEWVMVLEGEAELTFDNGQMVKLVRGDHIEISAHTKHKVSWTKPNTDTVWLAVFYRDESC
ncbi:cupin domain-containing protein [Enterovibrio coralii]|uniref:Cupin n=1 Tax=Enterovibrio coralii TaxID=294935 RepID=A0A135ICM0_9GAMM|nr:cupin domain-containing protein [Enterovibrio coralii]KXF83210.1 cupin [Enterovibrio coralii]